MGKLAKEEALAKEKVQGKEPPEKSEPTEKAVESKDKWESVARNVGSLLRNANKTLGEKAEGAPKEAVAAAMIGVQYKREKRVLYQLHPEELNHCRREAR